MPIDCAWNMQVLDSLQNRASGQALCSTVVAEAQESYAKCMDALPASKRKEGGQERKKKEKAENAEPKSQQIRTYDPRSSSANAAVIGSIPKECKAYADDFNGRWRLTFVPTGQNCSVSWSACGSKAAAAVAIRQGWIWSELYNGTQMPAAVKKTLSNLER